MTDFATRYRNMRLRALKLEYADADSADPAPLKVYEEGFEVPADLDDFEPPDPYEQAIRVLQDTEHPSSTTEK